MLPSFTLLTRLAMHHLDFLGVLTRVGTESGVKVLGTSWFHTLFYPSRLVENSTLIHQADTGCFLHHSPTPPQMFLPEPGGGRLVVALKPLGLKNTLLPTNQWWPLPFISFQHWAFRLKNTASQACPILGGFFLPQPPACGSLSRSNVITNPYHTPLHRTRRVN